MRFLTADGPTPAEYVTGHVALPASRPADRAFIRLNMITSADGGSMLAGVSSGLGNRDDQLVFGALRAQAEAVLVGMSTVVSEHYHAPAGSGAPIFVIAKEPDVSGDPELFASGRATLVLPEDTGPAPDGVPTLRAGTGGRVDLAQLGTLLAGKVVMMEGGPTLAGAMVALGLIDEMFVTVAPRVISGESTRIVHGRDADPAPWALAHGFVDDQGFLFLRYARPNAADR